LAFYSPGQAAPARYANLVVVAKSGAAFTDPIAAIESITTASSTNPYLLEIMPGVYDLGSRTLAMKEYVDIAGSGENVTVITSGASDSGTVSGGSNAELRQLTVRNTGTGSSVAIRNIGVSPVLSYVTAAATGVSLGNNTGIYNQYCPSVVIRDVTVNVSGGAYANTGIFAFDSPVTMNNVTVTAVGSAAWTNSGVSLSMPFRESACGTMSNVTATASGGSENSGVSALCSVGMSNINASASGTATTNYGVLNTGAVSVMDNVTASASGGGWGSVGVYNSGPAATINNVTASASGGLENRAIWTSGSSSVISNTTAIASGGTVAYGIVTNYGSPVLRNVTATGGGASRNVGMWAADFSNVSVERCTLDGNDSAIDGHSSSTVNIAASKLSGGVGGGTFTCVASYNGLFAPLSAACQ